MGFQNCLKNLSKKIDSALVYFFQKYAAFNYRYPALIIIGCLLLVGGLFYNFTQFTIEWEEIKL